MGECSRSGWVPIGVMHAIRGDSEPLPTAVFLPAKSAEKGIERCSCKAINRNLAITRG